MVDWLLLLLLTLMPTQNPCLTLEALDLARSTAWAHSSESALRRLYVDEAAAEPDVELLRQWADRGVRIAGMRYERRDCTAKTSPTGGVRVKVTERFIGGTAVLPGGTRRALPNGSWQRREIPLTGSTFGEIRP